MTPNWTRSSSDHEFYSTYHRLPVANPADMYDALIGTVFYSESRGFWKALLVKLHGDDALTSLYDKVGYYFQEDAQAAVEAAIEKETKL